MNKVINLLNAALLVVMIIGVPHMLFAQTAGEGLQIKPAVIEDKVNPGDTFNFTLTVTNISPVEKKFFLLTQDITGLDERGVPQFSKEGEVSQYELSQWITLPVDSVVLAPGEVRSIPFVITVPLDAAPGSHFGGVFLDAETPKLRTTGAAIGIKVGSIISLKISGEVIEEVRLREFSSNKVVYNEPVVSFEVKAENMGNTLSRPHGLIEVANMMGTQVASVRVNEKGSPIFPGGDKIYSADWTSDRFSFGRYQAVVSMVYGDDGRTTITAATSFWVLPLKFIVLTLGSLVGLVGLLYAFTQMYIRRTLARMGVTKRTDMGMYARRYQKSSSRLMVVMVSLVVVSVFFLGLLFLLFA